MKRWVMSQFSRLRTSRRRTGMIAVMIAAMVLIQGSALLALPLVQVGAAQATLTGTLSVIFADPAPGTTLPINDTRYFLRQSDGSKTELILDASVVEPFGGARPLIGQDITTTVNVPVGPLIASNAPRTVTAITLAPGARLQPRDPPTGSQPFANLLCKFADKPTEPQTPAYVQSLMQLAPDTVATWWQTVSYRNIDVTASQTFPAAGNWYTLRSPEASYLTDPKTMNEDKIAVDCTNAAVAAGVSLATLNGFKGINFLVNDSLVTYALGGFGPVNDPDTGNLLLKPHGLTWLTPPSYGQVPPVTNPDGTITRAIGGLGTMEHEMGHAFLLWHSGNINGKQYQDSWDTMGDPDVGCSPFAPPTMFGCTGQSITSYDKDYLGWTTGRRFDYTGVTRRITLDPLMPGTGSNFLLVRIPHTSAINFTYVEMRVQSGIDTRVPGNGVIIHEIDTTNTSISKRITSVGGNADALRSIGQPYAVPGAPAPVNVIVTAVTGNTATVVLSNGQSPNVTSYTGSLTAGSMVTLLGTNFSPDATLTFNGTPATTFTVNPTGTSITVTVPNGVTGMALPYITNPDGLSGGIRPNVQAGGHANGTNMGPAGAVPSGHTGGTMPGGTIIVQPNRH